MPALNILKIKRNEGVDYAKELRLLFAGMFPSNHTLFIANTETASGDIKNMVKSFIGLPETYGERCEVVLSDKDPDIAARNAILLLVAFRFSPEIAMPLMLHLWYSAMISADMLRSLRNDILPCVKEVCEKNQAKSPDNLVSQTWKSGTRSLRLVLTKELWDRLPLYFEVPDGLSKTDAQALRTSTTLAPNKKDRLDRTLLKQPPAWRVCTMKFRTDGILLPFGSSREEFDTPNP